MQTYPEHLRLRLDKLEAECKSRNLSSVVVYGRGSNLGPATKSHGYMRYLCDWDGHQNDSVLIVTPGRPPVLLVSGIFSKFFAQRYYWIEDTRFVKAPLLGNHIAEFCGDAAREAGAIGVVGANEMPVSLWQPFTQGLNGVELVDMSPYLDQERVVKDAFQLSRHQAAADVCDQLFDTLRKELRTPRPVFQLQAELERVARYAGAEYCMTWLTVGPEADYCRFFKEECRHVPQKGDQVLLGIYLMLDGYWGHAIRTGSLGEPDSKHQQVFKSAQFMWEEMMSRLEVGNDLATVHQAAEDVLCADYPDRHEQVFRFRHGHGLGHSYEDPVSSLAFPQAYDGGAAPQSVTARAGMLFEVHPNLFVPDLGGAAIGDMVVITPEGNKTLTNYPRHLLNWMD